MAKANDKIGAERLAIAVAYLKSLPDEPMPVRVAVPAPALTVRKKPRIKRIFHQDVTPAIQKQLVKKYLTGNWSQRQLAEFYGLHKQTVATHLKGVAKPFKMMDKKEYQKNYRAERRAYINSKKKATPIVFQTSGGKLN